MFRYVDAKIRNLYFTYQCFTDFFYGHGIKVKQIKKTKELEAKVERQKLIDEINLANIENYDGTEFGQQDFPKE